MAQSKKEKWLKKRMARTSQAIRRHVNRGCRICDGDSGDHCQLTERHFMSLGKQSIEWAEIEKKRTL